MAKKNWTQTILGSNQKVAGMRKNKGVSRAAKITRLAITSGVLGLVWLGRSARRAGLSIQAQFLRLIVLPLMFPKKPYDPIKYEADIALDHEKGPALPSQAFRKKFYVKEDQQEGQRTFTVAPRGDVTNSLRILYVHGGAYILDLWPQEWAIIEGLINRTGATVVVPIYPLAPEHDWQPAFKMVNAAYERLINEVGEANVVIAGSSAGGGITLALAEQMRDQGKPLPAALVLFSPWLDVTMSDPDQPRLDKIDHILSIEGLRRSGAGWAGQLPTTDPRISPLLGSLAGLPAIVAFTGTEDLLNPDARRLAIKAKAAGISFTLYEYPHEFHVWMGGYPKFVPEGRRALDQAASFVQAHLSQNQKSSPMPSSSNSFS
jgi:monoterpene epsilon-lactone hydrolase